MIARARPLSLVPILAALIALLAAGHAVGAAGGCGGETMALPKSQSSELATDVLLYVIDEQGRVHRARFGAPRTSWQLVNDTGLARADTLEADEVGRWVLHGGRRQGELVRRLWLLDLHSGIDRPVPVTVSSGAESLSPDGRTITRLAYVEDKRGRRALAEWIDTTTLQVRRMALPAQARDKLASGYPEYRGLDWTDAGDLVYSIGNEPRRFFLHSRASASFLPIAGSMDQGPGIVRDGSVVPLRTSSTILPNNWLRESHSADGWRAEVDARYAIRVARPAGDAVIVAQGKYDDCEGPNIGILGWLDGHRFVVYSIDQQVYAYDTAGAVHVKLFDDEFSNGGFAWQGWRLPR